MSNNGVPKVATIAFNVKGADLLFLDHADTSELQERDLKMWKMASVDIQKRPFRHVTVYVPMADDGLNRNTLRTNPEADQPGYSETREFALGIRDLWPYLDMFFDEHRMTVSSLLAEVEKYFEETDGEREFTLAQVLNLFETQINLPLSSRKGDRWEDFSLATIRAVYQRFRSLPSTLGGLIDVAGQGFGLDRLASLDPFDMVVIDFEQIMANPQDPGVAETAIKILTAYVLKLLTEAMTRGTMRVDHVIVFADELNRLAPRDGKTGIGEYLAQLARTTRDRGIILFGAGQFRSGIHQDILKAASVHCSMQTPDYELDDRIYSTLTPEFKARLGRLHPGEMLLQYPSMHTPVFAHFPLPFVFTGATKWREKLPPSKPRPMAECVHERLTRLDKDRPPDLAEVKHLLSGLDTVEHRKNIAGVLRDIEMVHSLSKQGNGPSPWEAFSRVIKEKFRGSQGTEPLLTPKGFVDSDEEDTDG